MPEWLITLTAQVVGTMIAVSVSWGFLRAQVAAVREDVIDLKRDKLDVKVHEQVVTRLDGRIDGAYTEISRERHRINNFEQGRVMLPPEQGRVGR